METFFHLPTKQHLVAKLYYIFCIGSSCGLVIGALQLRAWSQGQWCNLQQRSLVMLGRAFIRNGSFVTIRNKSLACLKIRYVDFK